MKTLRNLFAAALATAAILFTVGCPTPSEPTPPEEPVAAVTFTPNGGAVNSGSQVRLDTATSDAEIYYAIDPANAITAENVKDMLSSMTSTAAVATTVEITKACTIYAVAVRSSTGTTSEVTSATYTLTKAPGTVAFNPATGTVVPSGTKVKLSATLAEGEESCTIYYSLTTALTDENYSTAGTVYDQAGDGIEITANTTIHAIAVGTTNNPGNPSSASYTLPVTLMQAAPEADDVVYIYYPTGKNVMLSTPDGSKLKSEKVEPDSTGSFTTTDSMAALTVFKNEIGQYVFVSGGKYLTSGATGNSLTLADTFSYLALWDVAAISEGSNTFLIHSANAIFGANRQSLEFYSGFTVYNRPTSADTKFQFQFYKDPSKASELNAEAKASLAVAANALEEPKFSVAAGEVVPGTITKLSSASLDAEFWYTTDPTKADKEHLLEMTKYDDSKGIEVTGKQGDSVTYYALAGRLKSSESSTEGVFSTAVAKVTYTIGQDTNTYISLATSLAENDVVAIYNPDSANSISATVKGNGFAPFATTVTSKGMVVKKGDVSENLTFFTAKEYASGDYVFISNGKYLTSGATGSTLTLSESLTKYSLWNLEKVTADSDDGNFFIKSKNAAFSGQTNQYIQYDKRTNYLCFVVYGKNNNEQFTYQFYKMTEIEPDKAQAKVLSPEFSVPSGQSVASNTPIVVASDTEGAEYYWQWKSDGDLTAENYATVGTKYDAADPNGEPKVTKNDTLQAIAVKDGSVSNVVTATYTVNNDLTEVFTLNPMSEYSNSTAVTSVSGTNFTLTFDKGSNQNDPKYYTNSPAGLRFYTKNSVTVTSSQGKKISAVKFDGKTNKTRHLGELSVNGTPIDNTASTSTTTVTYTAESPSSEAITFVLAPAVSGTSGSIVFDSITIYYAE